MKPGTVVGSQRWPNIEVVELQATRAFRGYRGDGRWRKLRQVVA